jgi:hypothetical protein
VYLRGFGSECVQARPVTERGTYVLQEPTRAPLPEVDQHWYRTFPWARGDMWRDWRAAGPCLMLPLYLGYLALRRRWIALSVLIALDALVVAAVCCWRFWMRGEMPLYPEERYRWEDWPWLLYYGALGGAVLVVLWVVTATLVSFVGKGLARRMRAR